MRLVLATILKNKYFWYVLIGLILFFIIKRQWNSINAAISRTFNKDKSYEIDQSGNLIPVNEERVKALASKLNVEIKSVSSYFNSDDALYKDIYSLNDQDLEFMAKYYDGTITRKGRGQMYKDIQDESIMGDIDELIMNRLSVLGQSF